MRSATLGAVTMALPRIGSQARTFVSNRPAPGERKFSSRAVEATISKVKAGIGDPELAWMFENCYPNTLDTTVQLNETAGRPDTFVITGDIDAMWLRDSACQVLSLIHISEPTRPY